MGVDAGASGRALGSAFLGESLSRLQHWTGPAVVERRQFSLSTARLSVAGGREERTGSRRGTSAREEVVPKRSGWQRSSWPPLLIQIGWPRRILITAQLLSP